jgi:hypothetical protein
MESSPSRFSKSGPLIYEVELIKPESPRFVKPLGRRQFDREKKTEGAST